MPDGLRLALTTLTVARVRGPGTIDRRTAGVAMSLAPLVGLALGLVAAVVLIAFRQTSISDFVIVLPAAACVTALALLTRGLHLDGLVDTADGLASYKERDEALAIMRDPGAGALGVAVLVFVVLLQVAALGSCVYAGRGTASILLATAVGRLAVTWACTPPTTAASPTGLGALVAGTVHRHVALAWTGVLVVFFAGYEALDDVNREFFRFVNAGRVVLAVALALLVARWLRRHCVRRLGGINGDVLGALVEITTLVVLLVMSLQLPSWLQPS